MGGGQAVEQNITGERQGLSRVQSGRFLVKVCVHDFVSWRAGHTAALVPEGGRVIDGVRREGQVRIRGALMVG